MSRLSDNPTDEQIDLAFDEFKDHHADDRAPQHDEFWDRYVGPVDLIDDEALQVELRIEVEAA